jgi:carboxyl-terminal processing protease
MSESSKKFKVFLPLLFAVVLALGIFLGFKLRDIQAPRNTYFLNTGSQGPLQEILDLARLKYVDSVNPQKLKDDAIQGILTHLDPHSVYIPPDKLAGVNEDLDGSFQGIGVEFLIISDTINITSVVPGGPSAAAGLEIGDKFIEVNDSVVAGVGITTDRIKALLRGPLDTKVRLKVLRDGQLKDFSLGRGTIPLHSIDAAYMVAPGVGYIRINRFAANTYQEFMDAMLKLQKQGLGKLILDLRQNSGGYLDAAVHIADEFLSDHRLIVYTRGQHYPRKDYNSEKSGVFEQGPLAVLVDGGTASASEILAGAIQDWDRGTIIGRRTFGKGLVQEQYNLSDGGAMRLTVARYYIPSGRSIQRSYKGGPAAYYSDIVDRYLHGELTHADSIHFSDTTRYYTRVKHRPEYGGGGIMPDVFVPIDTVRLDQVMRSLYAGGTFFDFAYGYYDTHRQEFAGYKTPEDFVAGFEVSDDMLGAFRTYAASRGVPVSATAVKSDRAEIAIRIKALLARELWQLPGYYRVLNTRDRAVAAALKVLKDETAAGAAPAAPR